MSNRPRTRTQERILEATRTLLERDGAGGVRLEDVARRAGLSRQAVYLHFGSRSGLLVALVEYVDEVAGLAAQVNSFLAADQSAEDVLDAFLAWWLAYLPRIRWVADALLAERAGDEAADDAWRNRMNALHGLARTVVDRLAREGALAKRWRPADATDWLCGLISVQLYETIRERRWSHERYGIHLRHVVRAALLG